MYNFIDVNEASEGVVLPSEALKINGEYVENQISGYRTLTVTGREALSPDVMSFTTGVRDGSRLKSKRFPERIITVTYQLIAESNESFREAYNQLGKILNVEDAELIFNDEQDKFFIGTPCIIGSVTPGTNAVVGEFEILCTDPFKYSVVEYEAKPELDASSILIDYNGTYKAFPTLEADFYNEEESSEDGETVTTLTGAGDCGYVAFFTEDEKIVQIGDPDEVDKEEVYAKSQTLLNSSFDKSTSWGSAAKSQWGVNSGIASLDQSGAVGMAVASYATSAAPTSTSGTLLTATCPDGNPRVNYVIKAQATNRTANSVKVTLTITAALAKTNNYFGNGYVLVGSVYIGGAWRNVTLHSANDYWRGNSGHTKNLTVTVTGLSASTTSITGIKFKATRTDSYGTGLTGVLPETKCANLTISPYESAQPATHCLKATSYGSGAGWHGPSITRVLPADSSGDVGANAFKFTYSQKMSIGNESNATNQLGAFHALLIGGTGAERKVIAGVVIQKNASGKSGKLMFYVNDVLVNTTNIDLSHNNKYFDSSKTSTITKSRNVITFNVCGINKVFVESAVTGALVREVTFAMMQYGTKTPLTHNGLCWAKFVKNNCDAWKDIPNKFSANDVVEADCRNGEIFLNGVLTPSLGALGNDWEDFVLTPGLNQIGIAYSDWVEDGCAPTMKVRYREVFL